MSRPAMEATTSHWHKSSYPGATDGPCWLLELQLLGPKPRNALAELALATRAERMNRSPAQCEMQMPASTR